MLCQTRACCIIIVGRVGSGAVERFHLPHRRLKTNLANWHNFCVDFLQDMIWNFPFLSTMSNCTLFTKIREVIGITFCMCACFVKTVSLYYRVCTPILCPDFFFKLLNLVLQMCILREVIRVCKYCPQVALIYIMNIYEDYFVPWLRVLPVKCHSFKESLGN